ncbi:DUF58 domain-containing protein [Neptuniibacter sp.]|uniref:DUF58 domain-containing protein n=1 Tax=Neptuniibacter sp. TaxID=1962643 RepID=UPI003B5B755D
MFGTVTQPITAAFQRWASKRRPTGTQFELNQKRIFIFPTAAGWAYLLLCIIVFLVGTNYQNNLIHAVVYFLIAIGVLCIHYTFLNLSGLRISTLKGYNCYEGELAEFSIKLSSVTNRSYYGVQLSWKGEEPFDSGLESGQETKLKLYARSNKRGRLKPGSLLVETRYPFGLLRAWSWLKPDVSVLVYPKPIKGRLPEFEGQEGESEQLGNDRTGDDFSGLDEYQPGDSSRRIAWKHFAQGRGLLTKRYVGNTDKRFWLDWDGWPELGLEKKLSVICYWAQQLEHQDVEYGLRIPGTSIAPSAGPAHLEKVLISLANYPGTGQGIEP